MKYYFTSESVSEGHPDKVADQISDAILDKIIAYDPMAKVACETLVTTGQVVVAGEVKTTTYIDVQETVREVINKIGYTQTEYRFDGDSCGVLSALHEQSSDINRGVEKDNPMDQGAGDQGIMYGYATNETDNFIPLPLDISHRLLIELADIRKEGKQMKYLRPDSKSQVTIEYENNKPKSIHTIVISTQHDDFIKPNENNTLAKQNVDKKMLNIIYNDVKNILIPRVKGQLSDKLQTMFDTDFKLHVNPTGKFVIGGPHGDAGLTGRKIIVDTYGGKGAHGGGAFSGKDPSKVDRSAAYAARHIVKNMVAADIANEILIQISYAIGVAHPINIFVNTFNSNKTKFTDEEIAKKIFQLFDMRPKAIEDRLDLRKPIYQETATYGHMGRTPKVVEKTFTSKYEGKISKKVELFTWEKLDYVDILKKEFSL